MLQAIGFIMLLHLFLYFAWADQKYKQQFYNCHDVSMR